jgi:7-carboxy-7-deazaguanine synthase
MGCDTVYAVDRKHFGEMWMEIEELQTLIWIMNGYKLPSHVDIVLTGGEPLIYASEPIFVEFIEYLIAQGHRVTFETNATIAPDFERFPFYKNATYALSVKLSNSGEPENRRLKSDAYGTIIANAREELF